MVFIVGTKLKSIIRSVQSQIICVEQISVSTHLLAVAEELLELPAGLEHLGAGARQLEQVLPRRVQVLAPLGDHGRVGVAGVHEHAGDLADVVDALLADLLRVGGELAEALAEQLHVLKVLAELVGIGDHHLGIENL